MTLTPQSIPDSDESAAAQRRPLPEILRGFWFWIVFCSAISVLVTAIYRYMKHLREYPYGNPLFQRYSFQFDYGCYQERMRYFHQEHFFHVGGQSFAYPAPLALVYKFFYLFGHPGHRIYLATIIVVTGLAAWKFARTLMGRGLSPTTSILFAGTMWLTSYPLGVLLFLANMEWVVWMFMAAGLWAYVKGRGYAAAACIGVAGAMKVFPLAYLGIFLARKQYKQFATGVAVAITVNLAALAILGPTIPIAYRGLRDGLRAFQQVYVYGFLPPENSMDHSLYAIFKDILVFSGHQAMLPRFSPVYMAVFTLAGVTIFFTTLRRLPLLNLLLTLTIASILLPESSHDYNLMHLYAPWVLLTLMVLDQRLDERTRRGVMLAMGCFVLLFTAQVWLIYHGLRFAGQLKALTLISLFVVALRIPFATKYDAAVHGGLPGHPSSA